MLNEKIREILDTAFWKLRRPAMKTNGFHLIRAGTTIRLRNHASLRVGYHMNVQKRVIIAAVGGTISIGDYVSFNHNNIIACREEIRIGNHCAFGPNVVIYDHDHKFGWGGIAVDDFNTSPIVIEDNCWIGANVTILRGTHIGQGSVVGAGSIVKGDIPPHSLVKANRELVIEPIRGE